MGKANIYKRLLNKAETSFIITARDHNRKVIIILPKNTDTYMEKINAIIEKISK